MYHTLLVDDKDIFILELKRLEVWGKASGFQISGKAHNGKEALDMLRAGHYDLVITDVRMPKVDGIQLLQEIKRKSLCPCVALLSEYEEFRFAKQGLVLGAFDYLVKPVSDKTMSRFLRRTGKYLRTLDGGEAQKGEPGARELPDYPATEERLILSYILDKNEKAAELYQRMLENLRTMLPRNPSSVDIIARQVYLNLVQQVFRHFPWIENYRTLRQYDAPDIRPDRDAYSQKLGELCTFLRRFDPLPPCETIGEICRYILVNPEAAINLKGIADQFYMNHTYISNTFSQKIGVHFNDYVTMVKMERAKYLLRTSELKNYEIGVRLGYRDTEYFGKLFKRCCGFSPLDYRKKAGGLAAAK